MGNTQKNEVQRLQIRGAKCAREACEYNDEDESCSPVFAEAGFVKTAKKTCATASKGNGSPLNTGKNVAQLRTQCEALKYDSGATCTHRNPFALTFTNEYGSKFTTRTIECVSYKDTSTPYPTDTTTITDEQKVERAAAAEVCRSLVESALEDLPNSALADIDVDDSLAGYFSWNADNLKSWTPSGYSISATNDFQLDINFISNTGDIAPLTVLGQDTEVISVFDVNHHAEKYTEPDSSCWNSQRGQLTMPCAPTAARAISRPARASASRDSHATTAHSRTCSPCTSNRRRQLQSISFCCSRKETCSSCVNKTLGSA